MSLPRRVAVRVKAAVTGRTHLADVSSWQRVVTSAYPYPILSFRVDHGGDIDSNAHGNWAFVRDTKRMKAGIGYVVFKPGQGQAIFNRVTQFFGETAPAKLCIMIDMESGSDFAGPGNHSTEATRLAELFAEWLGSKKRVIGYANGYDWATNWGQRPDWMKRVTASYGTRDPGTWQWQYYGGMSQYPSPSGYPRSCPPFGSNVDMNVIQKRVPAVLADLGLTAPEQDALEWIMSLPGAPKGLTYQQHLDNQAQAVLDAIVDLRPYGDPASLRKIIRVWHGHFGYLLKKKGN